ncbi:GNAT family N-acetyltransferase [Rhizobium sp. AAP43]|uniref:GNAT family N-acetyltransferase n=1 Tax=Rhizobium sp. AAP43 TaxID=1523420 RepID=UPI0006B9C87D|nr:GNAT family N-acetyltransferase [Rhizobium sp. AAP43]KPF43765.1 acetyltransferase [Rhizobium sp. AAP43]
MIGASDPAQPSEEDALTIRRAESFDLAGLLALYRELNPDDAEISVDKAHDNFDALSRFPGSAIYVGLIDQTIATTCTLIVIPNLTRSGRPYALVENVVTASPYRGRGYGRKTLLQALSAAWENDCYKVMLLTGTTRPETLAFYKSVGFEQNKTGFQIRRIAARAD